MIRPTLIDKQSPFLGESCALCKEPFAPGEEIIICPDDATRHHVHCWVANGNKCTAYGCSGRGEPILPEPYREEPEEDEDELDEAEQEDEPNVVRTPRRKVRTMPSTSFGCAQGCLYLAIAFAIVVIALSCFGLWAIFDYLMLEVWNLPYREPLSSIYDFGITIS